ncbi:HEXXH motif-containing putative peptide modification protein [Streptomyces sp. NBC_00536]|uniref:aKG-HExxH-type peptide beta-hydroxylase n=1 Tax=Streptomyces sp. NBC_00536 TaxID=2975769 RepID=UPI002E8152AB|nr:HEXXH motif-containing putative peptide modification protein [Streptomyces sp. NBC_00536]WUC82437.1 HEXXH motif-containing putative peptide modification protein [Streptomyces sp. NBC_00536]
MRVQPDAEEAVRERTELLRRVGRVLERAGLPSPGPDGLRRPAVAEVAHLAARALRTGPLDPERRRTLTDRLDGASPSALGPADPQGHLTRSVARALRSIPARLDADGQVVTAEVVAWRASEREALARAVALLTRVWPAAAAEVRETVTEIALLDGEAIDGFTDFTVHGAVLVHRARLTTSGAGLPGPVRFAEALVHEGAHTRCNAAAMTEPFLLPDGPRGTDATDRGASEHGGSERGGSERGGELLVETPLRADPRPLTGLFQQTVVLARSVLLYRRLVGPEGPGGPAVGARHDALRGSAYQAVDALNAHADQLSDHGKELLAQCADVLGGSA